MSQRRGAPCYPRPAGQDARQTVFLPATGLLRSGPSNARGEAPAFLLKTSRTADSRKNLHAAIPSSRGRSIAGIVRPSGPGCSVVKAKATDARSASSMTRRVVTTGRAVVVARDLSKRDATPRRAEPGGERENRNETADSVAEAEHGVRQFCRDTALFKQTRRTAPRHGAGAGRPSPTNARAQERRDTGPGSFRRPERRATATILFVFCFARQRCSAGERKNETPPRLRQGFGGLAPLPTTPGVAENEPTCRPVACTPRLRAVPRRVGRSVAIWSCSAPPT